MSSSLIVVIRSVGERTKKACVDIVSSQLNHDCLVYEIEDMPFEEAHIRSVRLAAESNAKWAIFLDADILLRENALTTMRVEAESLLAPFYMLNFRILDLGFAGPTYGVHFYDVKYLNQALEFEALAWQDQRPETRMVLEMQEKKGISSAFSSKLVGLHGYEQSYNDLYRTSFVRGVKFKIRRDYLLPTLRSRCFEEGAYDRDYQVMLWGWLDGSIYSLEHEKAPLDKAFYHDKASQLLTQLGMYEKEVYLQPDRERIEQIICNHITDALYLANQYWLCPSKFPSPPMPDRSLRRRLRSGLGRIKKWMIG